MRPRKHHKLFKITSLTMAFALIPVAPFGTTFVMAEELSDEPVTIHVFHNMLEQNKNDGLTRIEDAFSEKYPNVSFENSVYNQGTDYFAQLETAIASGDMPECMFGNPGMYSDLIEGGFVKDLTGNAVIESMNLDDATLGDASYEGRLYAYPVDFKTWGVFYNKTIFNNLGLEIPTTLTELLEICQTLKDNGIDPWAECYSDISQGDIQMRPIVWTKALQNGDNDMFEQIMNGDKQVTDYPYFKEGLESWQKRMGDWMRPDAITNTQVAADEVFISGQAAMIYNGIWNHGSIETLLKDGGTDFDYDFFLCPMDDEGVTLNLQVDQCVMINPQAENADWACKFMEFWLEECSDMWGEDSLQPVVTAELNDDTPDFLRNILATKESGNAYYYGSFTKPFSSAYTQAYRTALAAFATYCCTGQATDGVDSVDSCLEYMQELFDEEYEQAHL